MTTEHMSASRAQPNTQALPIPLRCPYCDHAFERDAPGSDVQITPTMRPEDVEVVPYTRDFGLFDPSKDTDEQGEWKIVGSDYLSYLDWERIGILRYIPGQKIRYCVARCPKCEELFDVYVNYTTGKKLSALWPHLFASDGIISDGIKPYKGITLSMRLLKDSFLAFWIIIIFYIITLSPKIYGQAGTFFNQGGIDQFVKANRSDLLLRLGGAAILYLVILMRNKYLNLFSSDDFHRLFKISKRRNVIHWQNYTRCRFIGVQKDGKWFSLTQVMIFGGLLPVALMIGVWIYNHYSVNAYFDITIHLITTFIVTGLLSYLMFKSCSTKTTSERQVKYIAQQRYIKRLAAQVLNICSSKSFIIISTTIVFTGWCFIHIIWILAGQSVLSAIDELCSLLFWVIFAYYVGIHCWVTGEIPIYVLKGVRSIPMNVEPLTHYAELEPLERIGIFSTIGLILLLVFIVLVTTFQIFIPSPHLSWITVWLQIAIATIYVAIGIPLRGRSTLRLSIIAFLFLFIQWLLGTSQNPGWLTKWIVYLDTIHFGSIKFYNYVYLSNIAIFGAYIIYVQSIEIFGVIRGIKEKYKQKKLLFYQRLIEDVEIKINNSNLSVPLAHGMNIRRIEAMASSVPGLLSMYDRIEQSKINSRFFERVFAVISPIIAAIVAPVVVSYLSRK